MTDDVAPESLVGGSRIRILRLHLVGTSRPYVVDFRTGTGPGDGAQGLSLIAGPVSTGKSSVLEFIAYALGGSTHPEHEEVLAQVVACLLEIDLGGRRIVIRRTVGRPSTTAVVFDGALEDVLGGSAEAVNRPILPPSDPDSLSYFLLEGIGLGGVRLSEAPAQDSSDTDALSIRDVMWLSFMPNERLDNKSLLFESNPFKAIKLRQVVDVVFGVHDHRQTDLAARVKELETRLRTERTDLESATRFVSEQESRTEDQLVVERDLAATRLAGVEREVDLLRDAERRDTQFAAAVRERHNESSSRASVAANRVRDRQSLLRRLLPLRAQYSEDIRKLTMLVEAHALFDPLRVTSCPACFSALESPPSVVDQQCSLCGSDVEVSGVLDVGQAAGATIPEASDEDSTLLIDASGSEAAAGTIVKTHLRATQRRLRELNGYVEKTETQLATYLGDLDRAQETEAQTALALDDATSEAVTPLLAQRDDTLRRRESARRDLAELERSVKLFSGLRGRRERVGSTAASLDQLRDELAQIGDTAQDRDRILAAVSERFASTLADFKYPKLSLAMVTNRWEPLVRNNSYKVASSGGRTLISLAWILAVFEVAVEAGAAHPGFLMLDSPQKNIGGRGELDQDFADAVVVEGVYSHLAAWASEHDTQIIVVDNDPPASVEDNIILRFTRDPIVGRYGLIDNEVSTMAATSEDKTVEGGDGGDSDSAR